MSFKTVKIPILISVAGHALLIFCIIGAALWFEEAKLGGGSGSVEIVDVMVADGIAKSTATTGIASSLSVPRNNNIGKSLADDGGSGKSTGAGVGTGTGDGLGAGVNGDSALKDIWKKINHSKYYPALAKKEGIEGAPKVTFAIKSDGSVSYVTLAQSSGQQILDDAAIETVKRAAPLPYFPKDITLAVRYSLKDN